VGQQFSPHHDFLDAGFPASRHVANGGQRALTALIYRR
jgi:hypothetical protein